MSLTEYSTPAVDYDLPSALPPMGKLADALAKAQAKISNPAKTALNPHFKSNYANLATGIDSIRAALGEQGIAFVQTTAMRGEMMVLYTRLIHSSGEWVGSEWPVAAYSKVSPQQMGSALTYARRYSLFSIVGIAGHDDDDDGNIASSPPARPATPPPPPPPPPGKRLLPKTWREDVRKLFKDAKSLDSINAAYDKSVAAYRFEGADLEELDAILREVATPFWEGAEP
jgi:ERF superfamily